MERLNAKTVVPGPRSFSLFNLMFALLFVALCALSLVFVLNERSVKTGAEIAHLSQDLSRRFSEALRLSVENMRSTANLIVFLDSIDYPQFRDFTAQNFDSDPGLLLLEWQPVVPGSEREAFEEEARMRGLPGFRLWEPDESGAPVPARQREVHVPVYFMRSRDGANDSISTLGLDLAWSPLRMRSKLEARDSGRARGSQLFEVVTGLGNEFNPLGFAITLPVYNAGYVPSDILARREGLAGYLAGVYALEDVIRPELEDALAQGLSIDLHDSERDHGDMTHRLMLSAGEESAFEDEVELDLYGNRLHLRVVATDRFLRSQFEPAWLVLPAAVLLLGLVTLLFLRRLESGQKRLMTAQIELEALNLKLRDLSAHDPLTGLYNRRAFESRIKQEIDRAARHGEAISLLLADIDHFKEVNDSWGHSSGDEVLVEFAEICRRETRNIDMVARWGGEEFAILLSHTQSSEALRFAERLRKQIAELRFRFADQQTEVSVTVSVGISTIDENISATKWLEQADKALYLAKRSGRNCVRVFE